MPNAFPSRQALMQALAHRIAEALRTGIAERGSACVALSGGTTPEPAYCLLAREPLAWQKVTLALVDERFVPTNDPRSNEGLLRRALAPAIAAGAQLAPMYASANSLKGAAARAEALYASLRLDFALMGMGADGHTASWFAGAEALSEALDPDNARTIIAIRAPQTAIVPERLSLTLSALKRCANIALLITGADKRTRLDVARKQTPAKAPVAALFAGHTPSPEVFWAP